ncbi:group II intron reverse transcriptase/maturase [Cutibacterium avidum]|uniref:RNA-directed DNA polymerase (Reverse transcriptase) n=1 Tax=Syntrophomonas wolfei subsp. wolfei (strain DSM 2245B / Goettingen) TaxID=335541 RepID=Q0AU52_SYNWW|nr:group II intron reverse transcriptase/maturase [Syntrophomonas wolfei]ABI67500.1 RNA-directed DNA polymerase (reverse transcriptase) [Syntrophomonas wolfei subsp. wolfei str. Goettingen G311]ABI67518.1 RNA-directed DNA polymerase (reverse transcriptase) [Syntrophomonas wolfei subsp. wolfei str. Goettingen G311]ABI67530.1 RNA-directed DNA polymerase (reverse transcriptase) [Syntrophomonas wolfei subsp. wolfei str. Goettingen G311]ABI69206.1 RNA-directed DNA polymerase (reverse transcriptase) 
METGLVRIAEIARQNPKERFTALIHHINHETLKECHLEISGSKASGVDQVTKQAYEENLEANIADLIGRMKRQAYKPQPVRRVYIPKEGSNKRRPLGIPSYEDKLVQKGLARILNTIYEQDFLDCSFGFRPGRGCHDALKVLNHIIERKKVNYIVDADIRGFFDHVDHEWMMKFLELRIADPNLLRLIKRFLKAGVMEAGIVYDTPKGTPQGGIVSPILANIYLHYVLDLWFEKVVKKRCQGEAYLVRYADDFVCCFQNKSDAEWFYANLRERLNKFNLEVAEEKTRIIAFGRFADKESKKQGRKKPDTFDFLGFTHYCSKSKKGWFRVKRKTSQKKYRSSLLKCKTWLRKHLISPTDYVIEMLQIKLQGYYRYYGITDNSTALRNFCDKVRRMLFKWFNRRSQRKSMNWDKYVRFLNKHPLPKGRIYVDIYDVRPELLSYLK